MLWWQIKSDIREGIVQQWKRFAMLGIIYAVCVIYFIMICSFSRHIDSYTCGDMILWVLRGVKKYDSGVIKTVDISSVYMLPNIFVAYCRQLCHQRPVWLWKEYYRQNRK